MDGLSLHNYTVPKWPPSYKSVGFGETEYAEILKATLEMDRSSRPTRRSWTSTTRRRRSRLSSTSGARGTRRCPARNPGFLVQQNSLRDAILAALNLNIFARHADRVRMANIAQMINVLQAMILTDKEKMVLTPTYHVFRMYVPFQDATFVPVTFDAGTYTHGDIALPRVDAIAAKDTAGKLWLALTNLDPNRSVDRRGESRGPHAEVRRRRDADRAAGRQREHLRGAEHRRPKPMAAKVQGGTLALTLEPKSVTVISVEQ